MTSPPKDLDDLLALLPGMRKQRFLNAGTLRMLLNRPRRHCTWCGKAVPKGRQTWCSQSCVDAFNLRCSPPHQKAFVEKRDEGICQLCGRNTVASRQFARRALRALPSLNGSSVKIRDRIRRRFGYGGGSFSQVDHIVPVCRGGGLCSVENLRLLCGSCHLKVTAEMRRNGVE